MRDRQLQTEVLSLLADSEEQIRNDTRREQSLSDIYNCQEPKLKVEV